MAENNNAGFICSGTDELIGDECSVEKLHSRRSEGEGIGEVNNPTFVDTLDCPTGCSCCEGICAAALELLTRLEAVWNEKEAYRKANQRLQKELYRRELQRQVSFPSEYEAEEANEQVVTEEEETGKCGHMVTRGDLRDGEVEEERFSPPQAKWTTVAMKGGTLSLSIDLVVGTTTVPLEHQRIPGRLCDQDTVVTSGDETVGASNRGRLFGSGRDLCTASEEDMIVGSVPKRDVFSSEEPIKMDFGSNGLSQMDFELHLMSSSELFGSTKTELVRDRVVFCDDLISTVCLGLPTESSDNNLSRTPDGEAEMPDEEEGKNHGKERLCEGLSVNQSMGLLLHCAAVRSLGSTDWNHGGPLTPRFGQNTLLLNGG
eukprot:GHVS01046007.1.p1 GENE.GHVS01046007.1~~GHVS01046007.1.p1  ORF type:complete len:373 (-),score=68.70 GHVS01046007.1:152-1270(-)